MITRELQSFGAEVQADVTKKTTHVVVSNTRARTQKVRKALKIPHIKVVSYGWLQHCYKEWKRVDEIDYLIENHSPAPLDPNYSAADTDDEVDGEKDDPNPRPTGHYGDVDDMPGSQESLQTESDYDNEEDGDVANSPVEGLGAADWDSMDNELAEFMESDSEMDGSEDGGDEGEGTGSPPKRKSDDISQDEDKENGGDAEDMNTMSQLAKRQRRVHKRSTNLKHSKNVGEDIDSGLPTPDVTGGEENDDQGMRGGGAQQSDNEGNDSIADDDLENMMFAELQNDEDTDEIS